MRINLRRVEQFYDLPDSFLQANVHRRFGEISFSTDLHGWTLFDTIALYTGDGGRSWRHIKSRWPGTLLPTYLLAEGTDCCWIVFSQIGQNRPTRIPLARICKNEEKKSEAIWIGSTNGWYRNSSEIFFADLDNGWLAATEVVDGIEVGVIFATRDSGQTWQVISRRPDVPVRIWFMDDHKGWQLARGQAQDAKRAFRAVLDEQPEEVLLIGGHQTSVLSTTDGGAGWTVLTTVNYDLYALAVVKDVLIAAGERGLILRSTNGGMSWHRMLSRTREDIYSINFYSDRGLAVGDRSRVLFTENAGESWSKLTVMDIDDCFHGIHFANDNSGVLVGSKGMYQFHLE